MVAHLGQSLDGRIAAANGASRWVTGAEDVVHNHRMRALFDAVVVGAGTVRQDDPQLTVRAVPGPASGPGRARHQAAAGVRTTACSPTARRRRLLLCAEGLAAPGERHRPGGGPGRRDPGRQPLPARGAGAFGRARAARVFVEGGGITVSRFLAAGCLHRLQITVAPLIIGSGRPSITLPEIERVSAGLRPEMRRVDARRGRAVRVPARWLRRPPSGSSHPGGASCAASRWHRRVRAKCWSRRRRSGISRGTETLVFQGRVPASQHQAMRAPFQAGGFGFPLKYGYSSVGDRRPTGAPELIGRRVFCLYPHQDRYVVPASAVLPLPDAVPDARAVLAANMETALNGLWDAAPRIGDRIAVIGAGVVGALAAALLARMPGTEVQLIDIDPGKAAVAAALGRRVRVAGRRARRRGSGDPRERRARRAGRALELAGFEATIVELGWYGDRAVGLPLGEAFHSRRLRLISSQVGAVARRPARPLGSAPPLDAGARAAGRRPLRCFARAAPAVRPPAGPHGGAGTYPSGIMCQVISYR